MSQELAEYINGKWQMAMASIWRSHLPFAISMALPYLWLCHSHISKLLLISELPFSQDIAGIVKEKLYDCLKIVVQEVRGYSSLNEYSVLNSYTYITTTKDNGTDGAWFNNRIKFDRFTKS
jgi:hypothetical protein